MDRRRSRRRRFAPAIGWRRSSRIASASSRSCGRSSRVSAPRSPRPATWTTARRVVPEAGPGIMAVRGEGRPSKRLRRELERLRRAPTPELSRARTPANSSLRSPASVRQSGTYASREADMARFVARPLVLAVIATLALAALCNERVPARARLSPTRRARPGDERRRHHRPDHAGQLSRVAGPSRLVTLGWVASSDAVGVSGYRLFTERQLVGHPQPGGRRPDRHVCCTDPCAPGPPAPTISTPSMPPASQRPGHARGHAVGGRRGADAIGSAGSGPLAPTGRTGACCR